MIGKRAYPLEQDHIVFHVLKLLSAGKSDVDEGIYVRQMDMYLLKRYLSMFSGFGFENEIVRFAGSEGGGLGFDLQVLTRGQIYVLKY